MGIFSSEEFNSLGELFEHELRDLYDAEHRLTDALPQMADKASNPSLKAAFETHLRETERQIERLQSIFEQLGIEPDREKCDAMVGLIKEGSNVLDAEGDANVLDAALIASAQRAEHYEIAAYGTAAEWAKSLELTKVSKLLGRILGQEEAADKKLTSLAEGTINPEAAAGVEDDETEDE